MLRLLRILLLVLPLSFALLACGATHVETNSPASLRLENGSAGVVVYLQPSPEGARLTLRIAGVSAVREDGTVVPLTIVLREISDRQLTRERLFASGEIPAGSYGGLLLRFQSASSTDGDAVDLSLPEEPTRVAVPFTVERRRAVVVSLRFHGRGSPHEGTRITPVFSAEIPGKLAAGLIGLASNRSSDAVTIFDKVSGKVTAVVPTGRLPGGLALDPVRNRAYVALSGEDGVASIDVLEGTVIDHRHLTAGDEPSELGLTPDGAVLVSANSGSSTVSFIDAKALFETSRLAVGEGPGSVLIDRTGRRAYVFNTLSDSISVLDVPAATVLATITADSGPVRGDLSKAQDRLYVINRSSPYLTLIDPSSLSIVRRVYVGAGATAIKVDPRTDRIYLCRRRTGVVEIFDPSSFLPVDTIPVPGDVAHIALDLEGNNLDLALPGARLVRTVRLVSKQTVWESDMVGDPIWLSITGER